MFEAYQPFRPRNCFGSRTQTMEWTSVGDSSWSASSILLHHMTESLIYWLYIKFLIQRRFRVSDPEDRIRMRAGQEVQHADMSLDGELDIQCMSASSRTASWAKVSSRMIRR